MFPVKDLNLGLFAGFLGRRRAGDEEIMVTREWLLELVSPLSEHPLLRDPPVLPKDAITSYQQGKPLPDLEFLDRQASDILQGHYDDLRPGERWISNTSRLQKPYNRDVRETDSGGYTYSSPAKPATSQVDRHRKLLWEGTQVPSFISANEDSLTIVVLAFPKTSSSSQIGDKDFVGARDWSSSATALWQVVASLIEQLSRFVPSGRDGSTDGESTGNPDTDKKGKGKTKGTRAEGGFPFPKRLTVKDDTGASPMELFPHEAVKSFLHTRHIPSGIALLRAFPKLDLRQPGVKPRSLTEPSPSTEPQIKAASKVNKLRKKQRQHDRDEHTAYYMQHLFLPTLDEIAQRNDAIVLCLQAGDQEPVLYLPRRTLRVEDVHADWASRGQTETL